MNTRSFGTGVVVLIVIAVLVAAVVGGFGMTRTSQSDGIAFDAEVVNETPVVVAKHEIGGVRLFGVTLDAPDRRIEIGVVARPECLQFDDRAGEVLLGTDGCADYADLAGPIRGGGTTAAGIGWVVVWVDVGRACFEASTVGDRWRALNDGCA